MAQSRRTALVRTLSHAAPEGSRATHRTGPVSSLPLRVLIVAVATLLSLAASGPVVAGTSSRLMEISTDGKLLACTNRDSGTVTIVDLQTHEAVREIKVGPKPEGVTFLGDSHRLAVAVYAADEVVFLDADTGEISRRVEVFDEPYGIVSTPDGRRVYVTLDYPGQVVEIDSGSGEVVRSLKAGDFTRGLALDPKSQRVYVTEYYTTIVRAIDLQSGEPVGEWEGASTDNLARQIVLHPTRPKAYLPHQRSRITAVHGEGSIFPLLSIVDTDKTEGRRRKRIPMDAFRGAQVTANPWDVALSPDGSQLYIVFSGTNDMFACNVLDDDYHEVEYRGQLRLGNNPRSVCVAPDNGMFYVYQALDFEVTAYDTRTLRKVASIPVTGNPLGEEVRLGKILFYSALQPMVGRKWISCSSCHPDGDADGRTWHNPEGLRNTQAMAGLAWTHPLHWSADRDEVQDFEHTIRGKLMQGRGLVQGKYNDGLGEPNKGLSPLLDALAAYNNTFKFTLSPHAKNGLSESAQRGREVFFSKETKCATCHSGPLYTDSTPRKKFLLHDVGTGGDDPSELMGPKYDTPTLLGVYRTAPYLHHGRAATLREVLTKCNEGDRHGRTSHLSESQIDDLVEFLKALPYEDPEPAAEAAGLQRIDG